MLGRCVVLFALAGLATAVDYELAPGGGNRLALVVEKTGLMSGKKHVFVFERYRGSVKYDPASPEQARVALTIDSASAACTDTWVSEKDREKIQKYALHDMLAAEKYPELHFRSEHVVKRGENSFELTGPLTIRGVAKPVTVMVTVENHPAPFKSAGGHAVVRMKDYGLKPPTAALGTIGTKNEMRVEFQLRPTPGVQLSKAGEDKP